MTTGFSRRSLLAALPATAYIAAGDAALAPKFSLVVLTRHADKGHDDPDDPDLSKLGFARAKRLADVLAPSRPTRLLSSDKKRTRQTLTPLSEMLHVEIDSFPVKDVDACVAMLASPEHRVTIAASHSDKIPQLVAALGLELDGLVAGAIPDDEYGRLVVVTLSVESGRAVAVAKLELMLP